jgi:16S rRNA (cytosine1402-N4)-methyltransferase
LLRETIDLLTPPAGGTVIDCTVGHAGHASALAQRLGPAGLLIGLDVDPRNLQIARTRLADAPCRVRLFHGNFAELPDVLTQADAPPADAILADLGVSTNQLFDPKYGLSFASEMPLDMRLDPRLDQTAADLVNTLDATDLADLLFNLADEKQSRKIARKIVEARQISPIQSTSRLAALVRSVMPRGGQRIDPATRTFLALRIAVNHELQNLDALLKSAPAALRSGGRLALISFQSSEDRLIKHQFRSNQQSGLLKILTNRPLRPGQAEVTRNPRSRSAKLRGAQRC